MSTFHEYVEQLMVVQRELIARSQEHQRGVIAAHLAKSPESASSFEVGDMVLVSYPCHGLSASGLLPGDRGRFWPCG